MNASTAARRASSVIAASGSRASLDSGYGARMIQPDDMTIGTSGDLDAGPINGGNAYVVRLSREDQDAWITRRFPPGHPSGIMNARIRRDVDEDIEPWTVYPANSLIDEEPFATWGEALRFAMLLDAPTA
jgi:hypothetical protein